MSTSKNTIFATLITKLQRLNTFSLLNIVYIVFGLPFVFMAIMISLFFIPNNIKIAPDLLRSLGVACLIFGFLGPIVAGVIMIRRRETPAYVPNFNFQGKSAVAYGIFQIVISLIIIVILGISLAASLM